MGLPRFRRAQSTVSFVLNGVVGTKLSETTRGKVHEVAQSPGYQLPVRAAQPPAPAGDRNLNVYIADKIATSPHPVASIDGARDAAWNAGCVLAFFSAHGNAQTLAMPNVLGVIYATV